MAGSADQVLIVLLSALVGYGGKLAQDWWTARRARKQEDAALWSLHRQQFHLPPAGCRTAAEGQALRAGRDLPGGTEQAHARVVER
jgi:hypothetical protein